MVMENQSVRLGGEPADSVLGRRTASESVLDRESFFEGTYRTPGNLRIEGTYQGAIECQGTLVVAESAQVEARIAAGNLTVAGQLRGEAQCNARLEILRTGRVNGTVNAKVVVVHEGAFFEGDMRMSDGPRESAAAPVAPSAPARPSALAPAAPAAAPATPASVPAPDPPAPTTAERTPPPPRANGRGASPAREIIPNRTNEPA